MWAANTKFSAVHFPYTSLKLYTDIETLILNSILFAKHFF